MKIEVSGDAHSAIPDSRVCGEIFLAGQAELCKWKKPLLSKIGLFVEGSCWEELFKAFEENEDGFGRMLDCDMSQIQNATGFGKHKVVMSKSTQLGRIGNAIKYAGPQYGCGHNCVSIICDSKKESSEAIAMILRESDSSDFLWNRSGVFQLRKPTL